MDDMSHSIHVAIVGARGRCFRFPTYFETKGRQLRLGSEIEPNFALLTLENLGEGWQNV